MFPTMSNSDDQKEYTAMLNGTRTLIHRLTQPSAVILKVIQHKVQECNEKKEKLHEELMHHGGPGDGDTSYVHCEFML